MTSVIDPDTAFRLLSNRRRRQLLLLLAERDEELSLQEVADALAARLDETGAPDGPATAYQSIYVSLYQNHVPRLAEAGVVTYDETRRTVRIAHTPETRLVLKLLDAQPDRSWRQPYVGLSGLVVAVFAGSVLGPIPVVGAPWVLPMILTAVGLAAIGLHQYRTCDRIAIDEDAL